MDNILEGELKPFWSRLPADVDVTLSRLADLEMCVSAHF